MEDDRIARAKVIPIDKYLEKRGIKLWRDGKWRIGPCPICGGHDRFFIKMQENVCGCRGCDVKGDIIDLYCKMHPGCSLSDALDALVGPAVQPSGHKTASKPRPDLSHPGAVFEYRDSDGVILYRNVRYSMVDETGHTVLSRKGKPDKTFRQECYDEASRKWVPGRGSHAAVPYRLPELVRMRETDPTVEVYITEGERKADLLRSWGLTATSIPRGCQNLEQWLTGAHVVIVPDHDEAGRAYASAVAGSLTTAATVCTIDLPGLADGEDVEDWHARGGTRDQFLEMDVRPLANGHDPGSLGQDERGLVLLPAAAAPSVPRIEVRNAGRMRMPPPRGWLLGDQFCRRFVSSIVAPGGSGKSSLRYAQALAMATTRKITGQHIHHRCKVLMLSLEDDFDEMERRTFAACIHHAIDIEELDGWLFYGAPKLMKIAEMNGRERVKGKLEAALRAEIEDIRPDVVMLDPFVKTHSLEENDNGAMDYVCDILASMAIEYNVAVDVPHHAKKGGSGAGDADLGRGGSAIRDAARLVYTLTVMSTEEAETFQIEERERKAYVRLDSAKVNLVAGTAPSAWYRLVGVPLGNGDEQYPHGDNVQTLECWSPPETWDNFPNETVNAVLDEIEKGLPDGSRYSPANAAKKRAAWLVVQRFCSGKSEQHCRMIVDTWIRNGLLYINTYKDASRREDVSGLYVNSAKRPGFDLPE
jgi:hypothetical protein